MVKIEGMVILAKDLIGAFLGCWNFFSGAISHAPSFLAVFSNYGMGCESVVV